MRISQPEKITRVTIRGTFISLLGRFGRENNKVLTLKMLWTCSKNLKPNTSILFYRKLIKKKPEKFCYFV